MTIQTIDSTSNQPIVPVSIVGATSGNGSLGVDITTAEAIVPSDIQSHLQTTIQTHNAVSVGASAWSTESIWHDSDGFDKIACDLLNDDTTAMSLQIQWSSDGVNQSGLNNVIIGDTNKYSTGIIDTRARYFRFSINNGDGALAHTMSAWAYLKA